MLIRNPGSNILAEHMHLTEHLQALLVNLICFLFVSDFIHVSPVPGMATSSFVVFSRHRILVAVGLEQRMSGNGAVLSMY